MIRRTVYILNGVISPLFIKRKSTTEMRKIAALPYPVPVRIIKRTVKDGFAKPSARMEYTVEREDYECKRILFFGRKSDKF